ncbi:unnamed protein product [Caenorhabditis angaria]|uniref:CCHC-type domain-containing protein n=1 Tax=Caenorhabditis angaria TaxID=860376 RepID=A0A9P1IK88_9PELO|nr:unnamed protein product [Caenorhabditis angaria]
MSTKSEKKSTKLSEATVVEDVEQKIAQETDKSPMFVMDSAKWEECLVQAQNVVADAIKKAKEVAVNDSNLLEQEADYVLKPVMDIKDVFVELMKGQAKESVGASPNEKEAKILRYLARYYSRKELVRKMKEMKSKLEAQTKIVAEKDQSIARLEEKMKCCGEKRLRDQSPTPSVQVRDFVDDDDGKSSMSDESEVEQDGGNMMGNGKKSECLGNFKNFHKKRGEEVGCEKSNTEKWVRYLPNDDDANGIDVGSRKDENLEPSAKEKKKKEYSDIGRWMRTGALPDPPVFTGKSDENFEEFMTVFNMKFGTILSSRREKSMLLSGKFLGGSAKKVFESMDIEENWTWDKQVQEFEKLLNTSRVNKAEKANEDWLSMERKSDESLMDYLIEMERVAKLAFGNLPKLQIDILKTTKLLQATRRNSMLSGLLVMKRSDLEKGKQYAPLKAAALQFEHDEKKRENRKNRDNKEEKIKDQKKESEKESEDDEEKPRCYKCRSTDHFASKCPLKEVKRVKTVEGDQIEIKEKSKIAGKMVDILIDSGADVSLMSTGMLEYLKEGLKNWQEKVREKPAEDMKIFDANQKIIKVIKQVEIEVEIKGRTSQINFEIVKNKSKFVILGSNSFGQFGIYLAWKSNIVVSSGEVKRIERNSANVSTVQIKEATKVPERKSAAKNNVERKKGFSGVQCNYLNYSSSKSRKVATAERYAADCVGKLAGSGGSGVEGRPNKEPIALVGISKMSLDVVVRKFIDGLADEVAAQVLERLSHEADIYGGGDWIDRDKRHPLIEKEFDTAGPI